MISARKIHSEVNRRLRESNKTSNKKVTVTQVDSAINESISFWLSEKTKGMEIDPFVRRELRQLEVVEVPLEFAKDSSGIYNVFLPKDYYKFTRVLVSAEKETCGYKSNIEALPVKSSDLSRILNDPYQTPSFEWEEFIFIEQGDHLRIYLGGEDVELMELKLSYIKTIPEIKAPSLVKEDSYVDYSGRIINLDVDLELDESQRSWIDIVNLASLSLLRDMGQVNDYQLMVNQIMSTKQNN